VKGEIAMKYGIRSYPTFLFLNGDGEVVSKSYGYMDENQFLSFAKEANNPKLKNNSYKELFDKGETDPEFLINMMKLYSDSDYPLAKKVSERYFSIRKNEPMTREEVGLLLYFLKSPTDENYKIFTGRRAEIVAVMSEDIYKQFDVNIKLSSVMERSFDQKTGIINDDLFYQDAIPLVGKTEAETALNRMKITLYPNIGNFAGYEKAALSYYKKFRKFDPEELLKAAWIFSEHVSDPSSLKQAQDWAEKSVMKSETAENTYILAKLYDKSRKKRKCSNVCRIIKAPCRNSR
jgi:hypothetical protein